MNRIILALCCLVCVTNLNAQLMRGSANKTVKTDYTINGKPDSLFLFNPENTHPFIEAKSPTGDSVKFEWSYYNPGVGYSVIASDSAKSWKIDTLTSDGGYRLTIGSVATAVTQRCWVLFTDYAVAITSDINDTIVIQTCGYIEKIAAIPNVPSSTYYHPTNIDTSYTYTLKLIVPPNWTSDKAPEAMDPIYNPLDTYLAKVDEPYWEDTWYKIIVTDETGYVRSDSTFYKSIQPHASIDTMGSGFIMLTDDLYYPNTTDRYDTIYSGVEASAPALYHLISDSKNCDSLTWILGDGEFEHRKDTVHEYKLPGTYNMRLIAYKQTNIEYLPYPCTDTIPDSIKIIVKVPKIGGSGTSEEGGATLINVVRTGQGWNEWFRLEGDISIGFIEIAIYNQFGNRVHHYEGYIRNWEGWDCTNKGKYVSTGVYYYVVKSLEQYPNYDPIIPKEDLNKNYTDKKANDIYRGFFHVFNYGE